ncbi:alpha/beta hydrolase [Beijerinckia sp. L45]|uniref:alpha/beta hydrolase n=1 Tax=Beijerinckia sp. L45 TaxID=1641855 RepID=UPI00131B46EF|nr:alpha/beta hydrolase [Beijerinckia sp. L45]
MIRKTTLIAAMFSATAILAASSASAKVTPTLKDRFDQILATFMGDPSAGVDVDMKHVLDMWRSMGPQKLETLTPDEARKQPTPIEAAAKLLQQAGQTLDPFKVTTKDLTFNGPGGVMKVRVYLPADDGVGKPRPVVVFYHGGGFVLENAMSTDVTSRALAGTSGFIVVAPDYRLAPDAKFPAAPEDAVAAYAWVLANAASFGGDPARVALAGEGAGGMLAVDTSMAARDRKLPMPAAQILITPAAGIDMKTASYLQDAAARPWSEKAVRWAFGQFLANPAEANDPRIDMIGKGTMDGLPPTTIITAEIDPLRSDGERLGGKLKLATVPTELRDYPGVTHDFFGMGAAVEKAALAQRFAADRLKAAFAPPKSKAEQANLE